MEVALYVALVAGALGILLWMIGLVSHWVPS